MCWAGTSQPGWEDADAVKASGGPELCWLGSGPVYGTWAAGETEAGVGVRKGDIKRDFWRGNLSKAVKPEKNFMGLLSKPFLSTYCVLYTGLLATELNRTPMKGSP